MKDIFKGILVYLLAVITIAGIMFINDSQPTTQAAVPCEFCEGACTLFNKTACTTDHKEAPSYYYYTYECSQCGNKFTIEIVQE